MTNSADPDQLASEEANGSGSTLFAKTGHVVFSKRKVKTYFSDNISKFSRSTIYQNFKNSNTDNSFTIANSN